MTIVYKSSIYLPGVAEASWMCVCKILTCVQIFGKIDGLHQRKDLKSGCAAAHPEHPVQSPPFWNLSINHSTYTEIQAFWLVEQQQQRLVFRNGQGKIKNVWAHDSKDIIAKFNFLTPFSAKMLYQYHLYSKEFG